MIIAIDCLTSMFKPNVARSNSCHVRCHVISMPLPSYCSLSEEPPNLSRFFVFSFVCIPFAKCVHFCCIFVACFAARFKLTFALQSWQTRRRNDHGFLRCGWTRQSLAQQSMKYASVHIVDLYGLKSYSYIDMIYILYTIKYDNTCSYHIIYSWNMICLYNEYYVYVWWVGVIWPLNTWFQHVSLSCAQDFQKCLQAWTWSCWNHTWFMIPKIAYLHDFLDHRSCCIGHFRSLGSPFLSRNKVTKWIFSLVSGLSRLLATICWQFTKFPWEWHCQSGIFEMPGRVRSALSWSCRCATVFAQLNPTQRLYHSNSNIMCFHIFIWGFDDDCSWLHWFVHVCPIHHICCLSRIEGGHQLQKCTPSGIGSRVHGTCTCLFVSKLGCMKWRGSQVLHACLPLNDSIVSEDWEKVPNQLLWFGCLQ